MNKIMIKELLQDYIKAIDKLGQNKNEFTNIGELVTHLRNDLNNLIEPDWFIEILDLLNQLFNVSDDTARDSIEIKDTINQLIINNNKKKEKVIFYRGYNNYNVGDIVELTLDEIDRIEDQGNFIINYDDFKNLLYNLNK